MEKYIKDRIEITATLLVACKLTKEETISELNKLIESVHPISDTELIVPSEEEIEKEALERAKYESYPIDKDYDMQSFSDFVGAVKWAISEIKKLNK